MAVKKAKEATASVDPERAKNLGADIRAMLEKVGTLALQNATEEQAVRAHAYTLSYLSKMSTLL